MAASAALVECSEPSIGARIRLNMVKASRWVAEQLSPNRPPPASHSRRALPGQRPLDHVQPIIAEKELVLPDDGRNAENAGGCGDLIAPGQQIAIVVADRCMSDVTCRQLAG